MRRDHQSSRVERAKLQGKIAHRLGVVSCWAALASLALPSLVLPTAASAQSFEIAEPAPAVLERHGFELSNEDRQHYLDDWRRSAEPAFAAPFLRWGFGGELWFDNGETTGDAFAFDMEVGARLVLEPGARRGLALLPIAGYSLAAGTISANLASIGVGLGFEGFSYSMTYYARVVAGAVGPEAAIGLRHGAVVEMFNVLGFSISHEVLAVDERDGLVHGVRLVGTLDLMPFFLDVEEYFDGL